MMRTIVCENVYHKSWGGAHQQKIVGVYSGRKVIECFSLGKFILTPYIAMNIHVVAHIN